MDTDPVLAKLNARRLLAYGHTDEDVERVSGLSLHQIIGLRAEAASRPWAAAKPCLAPNPTYVDDGGAERE